MLRKPKALAEDRDAMPQSCLLYYITDRTAFAADEPTRRKRLLEKIAEATRAGVGYIQLREKDLPTRELESLAREAVAVIDKLRSENRDLKTALLINSRTDIALATGADGVHLRSDDLSPQAVRAVWGASHVGTAAPAHPVVPGTAVVAAASGALPRPPLIGVSCHAPWEVIEAGEAGAGFAVLAPIFEKKDSLAATPAGVKLLEQACRASIPVLALGGITLENAPACLNAGAAGIAAIRLFQENDIAAIVRQLRP